jgi:hypothetical protein
MTDIALRKSTHRRLVLFSTEEVVSARQESMYNVGLTYKGNQMAKLNNGGMFS